MKNRQKNKKIIPKKKKTSKENETYSVPKVVAERKSVKEVNRENNENDLFNTWIHNTQKLSKHDLGVINIPKDYPTAKKDRSFNNGVQRAKDDLKLLDYLLTNLKPKYKQQITTSAQFDIIIKKYLGISEFGENFTKEEKDMTLVLASNMLINALTVFKNNMPPQFNEILRQTGKPYFDMIEAIASFGNANNIKSIPKIHIPDSLR